VSAVHMVLKGVNMHVFSVHVRLTELPRKKAARKICFGFNCKYSTVLGVQNQSPNIKCMHVGISIREITNIGWTRQPLKIEN